MLRGYWKSLIKFCFLFVMPISAYANLEENAKLLAKDYALRLIEKDVIITRNGIELGVGNDDTKNGNIWEADNNYLPGGAVFIKLYDYNKDGYLDLGLSSSMSPYISELWLGGKNGYSKFASQIALGGTLIQVGDSYAIKHRYRINGSDSIDSYLWLRGKKSEFTTINSWESSKVKGGDSSPIILQNIKDDLHGKLPVEAIKSEDWVSWIFNLLDENETTTWINPDYSGGRFGLGEFIDKKISLYNPQNLTLAKLRENSLHYEKQDRTKSIDLNIREGIRTSERASSNQLESKQKESEFEKKSSNLPWIIIGVLLLGILSLLLKMFKGKPSP